MTILEKTGILPLVREKIRDSKIIATLRRVPAARLEFSVGEMPLASLLSHITSDSKIYWQNRSCMFESVGSVNVYNNSELTEDALAGLLASGLRFYISEKFDLAGNITSKWRNFGRVFVFLPLWSIERREKEFLFVLNYTKELAAYCEKNDINQMPEFELLEQPETSEVLQPKAVNFAPSKAAWTNAVRTSVSLIRSEVIQKVVLARLARYEFDDFVPSEELFYGLSSKSQQSFNFYFQVTKQNAFMGISPELLVRKTGNQIFCDVLAGTCENSGKDEQDKQNKDCLLADPKELEEHRIVVRYIKRQLNKVSDSVEFSDKEIVRRLRNVQHIYSSIRGEVSENVSIYDLIRLLSPTPAVCGFPQSKVFDIINSLELFDRGHYAGALGTICGKDAEICVAIRSGLVWGKRLYVFAGAGIVSGSEPEKEWIEIDNKMKNFSEQFSK